MATLFAVFTLLISGINISNYNSIDNEADNIINILVENNGKIPAKEEKDDRISAEAPYINRYFIVKVSDNNSIQIEVYKVAAISEEEVKKYAKNVINLNKNDGYFDDYKFRVIDEQNYKRIIFLDCKQDMINFKSFLSASIIIGLAGLILVFILVYFVSGYIFRPVLESYSKQKEFITNVNHEIKTPLSIINSTNDIIEIENGKSEWTDIIHKEIENLNALTNRLVFLSRMDEENTKIDFQKFNIGDVINEVAQPFIKIAKTKKKSIKLNIEPEVYFDGDESLIGELISILLDNAMKYSLNYTDIELSLSDTARGIVITVTNETDQVFDGKEEKLFERFYRNTSNSSGHGIGLSLAKAIVNAHRGKITVEVNEKNKIKFTIIL